LDRDNVIKGTASLRFFSWLFDVLDFFGGRNSVTKNKKDILRSSTGFEAEASNQRLGGSQRKEQQRKTPDALKVKGPKKQKKNKSDLHCMRK